MVGNSLHVVGLLERTSNKGLRPYIPPGEMPEGSRAIFHADHIPKGWFAADYVLHDSYEWFVCEKLMTGEKK